MKLLSVNIGHPQPLKIGRATRQTGIFKQPAAGPVMVQRLGLVNDTIANSKHHGGPDQAVYLYGPPDYDWWSAELGTPLAPGTFGENLTISGLESARFSVGDRLEIGEIIVEVTSPRIPCSTLATRMADPTFVKRFRAAERPGLYGRVIQTGHVQAGDKVTLRAYPDDTVTILEMFRDFYEADLPAEVLRRYLSAPIAIRDRQDLEKRLRQLTGETT